MSETKISLSPEELGLAANASLILTKNAIIEKTIRLFGSLQQKQQEIIQQSARHLPNELISSSPKISRGEYYKGLPYVVLDYPRLFKKHNVAAIRTMFWWGHFFSVTLHLSGSYKDQFAPGLLNSFSTLKQTGFYCCINPGEWEHHFEKNNYKSFDELEREDLSLLIKERSFIKLAIHFPVEKWNESAGILLRYFNLIIGLMEVRHPDGETVL